MMRQVSPPRRRLLVTAAALCIGLPSAAGAQEVLPRADFHFQGSVGRTYQDSDPAQFPQPVRAPQGAPNIVLVLLDDVGFGQFSVTGGGVPAPAMERLAQRGIVYNRFHTTALCSPTRAALLTGRTHHQAASAGITEGATGYDGYTSLIPRSTATFAEVLRQNGYATAWIGKNHNTPTWELGPLGPFDRQPNGFGFDYFYGFNAGDTSQYEPLLTENRNPVPRSADPNYHLSTDLADHAIAWMQRAQVAEPEKPFLLYLAPAATHSPHHAPRDWIDRFRGQFDMGWDAYRQQVIERQKRLSVIPADAELTPRPDGIPAWDSLNPDQQRLYARMMEVFAAYGAHVDHEVGRVLSAVEALPGADNTLVVYIVGDNGASAEGGLEGSTNENTFFNGVTERWQDNIRVMDELGGPRHFNHFPSGWAWAMNTPFQWTKQVASHFGGTRNPAIVSWPARIQQRGVRSQFHHVSDIAPTILEAAGIEMPRSINGVTQVPLEGISMSYSFADPGAAERRRTQVFEIVSNRGIYHDGWMASSLAFVPWEPNRTGFDIDRTRWELYNIERDFSQAHDLATAEPQRLRALQDLWWGEASRTKILPLDWRAGERLSDALTGRPNPAAGRDRFVYAAPVTRLPEGVSPDLKNRSFTITVEAELPGSGVQGMLFTQGGFTAGWGFYIQDQKLVGVHNYLGLNRYRATSSEPLPGGRVTLAMEFDYAGQQRELGRGGTIILRANGREVGRGQVERTTPFKYSLYEGQDIGEDDGSPVEFTYTPPFAFTGRLDKVTVELR